MRTLRLLLVFIVFVATVQQVIADDTTATLGAGGLVPLKSTKIVMESEDLSISVHLVVVKYIFRNNTDHDINATVAFPLPPLDGELVAKEPVDFPSENPINFLSFKVSVNGRVIFPKLELRAYRNDKDITARLRSLGLPVSVLDPKMEAAFYKLSKKQREQLESERLIEDLGPQAPSIPRHIMWCHWQTRIVYYWDQRFPAHGSVYVTHTYRPVVGGAWDDMGETAGFTMKHYCGTPEAEREIAHLRTLFPYKGDVMLQDREIEFILTTGNDWSGPIRSFHLTVHLEHSYDVLSTCMPGLKRTSPLAYELRVSNFSPKSNLKLLILQPYRHPEKVFAPYTAP